MHRTAFGAVQVSGDVAVSTNHQLKYSMSDEIATAGWVSIRRTASQTAYSTTSRLAMTLENYA
ncbi:MAG: hypothetical protein L0287_05545 [Anaerolineae bacterium]|nr:hypothetical protein [Anaerolineae bacterium]